MNHLDDIGVEEKIAEEGFKMVEQYSSQNRGNLNHHMSRIVLSLYFEKTYSENVVESGLDLMEEKYRGRLTKMGYMFKPPEPDDNVDDIF